VPFTRSVENSTKCLLREASRTARSAFYAKRREQHEVPFNSTKCLLREASRTARSAFYAKRRERHEVPFTRSVENGTKCRRERHEVLAIP
jgi:hypothetical protein